jgi:hypothetical protein
VRQVCHVFDPRCSDPAGRIASILEHAARLRASDNELFGGIKFALTYSPDGRKNASFFRFRRQIASCRKLFLIAATPFPTTTYDLEKCLLCGPV